MCFDIHENEIFIKVFKVIRIKICIICCIIHISSNIIIENNVFGENSMDIVVEYTILKNLLNHK